MFHNNLLCPSSVQKTGFYINTLYKPQLREWKLFVKTMDIDMKHEILLLKLIRLYTSLQITLYIICNSRT